MVERLTGIPRLMRIVRTLLAANLSGKHLKGARERALWQQKQAIQLLDDLKMNIHKEGTFPSNGLIVSNHLSYLDVIVLAAQGPAVFVAKSDVSQWPLIGNLLRCSGTILSHRDHSLKSVQTTEAMETALRSEFPVVLFPEGTTTYGESVRNFRTPFFQPAQDLSAMITPVAINYTCDNGDPRTDICYWGDHTFLFHLVKLASLRSMVAHVSFGNPQPCQSDRKASAAYFQQEVSRLHLQLRGPDSSARLAKSDRQSVNSRN